VIKSARVMKKAVAHLIPFMEEERQNRLEQRRIRASLGGNDAEPELEEEEVRRVGQSWQELRCVSPTIQVQQLHMYSSIAY